jgi:exopolysaccharide biosynthesis polyprenyl glycosylphosphotransferase
LKPPLTPSADSERGPLSSGSLTERASSEPAHLREVPPPTRLEPVADRVISTRLGRRDALTRRLLAVADVAGLTLAMALAPLIAGTRADPVNLFLLGLPTLFVWVVIFKLYGLYDRDIKRISHSTVDDLPWLLHALVIGGLFLWAYYKVLPLETTNPPQSLTFAEGAAFGLVALVAITSLRGVARRAAIGALGPERVLVAGTSPKIGPLVRKIAKHPEYGLHPIGRITPPDEPHPADGAAIGLEVVGTPADFQRVAIERAIERLVISKPDFDEGEVLRMILVCRALCLKVSLLPAVVDALGPSVEIDEVEGVTVLGVNPPILSRTSRMVKRVFDLVVAACMLVVAAVPMAAIAIAIKLDSRGPVIFRQRRVGRNGKIFELLKFRTMVADAEDRREALLGESSDPNWLALEHDPRITRVGGRLRLFSLDELPQLWNVIRGEMSLVGPRPLPEVEDRRIVGWTRGRLDLQPGITGLWQVLGRTSIPFDEMVKLDYLYVSNWSLWFDIRLLIRTLPTVLSRRGAG